jgi:hypothetical protein
MGVTQPSVSGIGASSTSLLEQNLRDACLECFKVNTQPSTHKLLGFTFSRKELRKLFPGGQLSREESSLVNRLIWRSFLSNRARLDRIKLYPFRELGETPVATRTHQKVP